jgi:hypothetical protein
VAMGVKGVKLEKTTIIYGRPHARMLAIIADNKEKCIHYAASYT